MTLVYACRISGIKLKARAWKEFLKRPDTFKCVESDIKELKELTHVPSMLYVSQAQSLYNKALAEVSREANN